jgi:hypothetical protein
MAWVLVSIFGDSRLATTCTPHECKHYVFDQASREIGLILEDHNVVAPHFWRWLRAAHNAYRSRLDLAGITLQRLHFCQQMGCPDPPDYPAGGPADLVMNPVSHSN